MCQFYRRVHFGRIYAGFGEHNTAEVALFLHKHLHLVADALISLFYDHADIYARYHGTDIFLRCGGRVLVLGELAHLVSKVS